MKNLEVLTLHSRVDELLARIGRDVAPPVAPEDAPVFTALLPLAFGTFSSKEFTTRDLDEFARTLYAVIGRYSQRRC